jgi:serine/threonine protein kinase
LAWLVNEPGQRLTPAQTAMGTTAYLAPEIAEGNTADEATDLYALGCTLYELACGRPPFQGTLPAMVLAHVNNEPAPPSTHRPDLPEDLQALILQLLNKDPARRPHSAEEVRRRLATPSEQAAVHRTPNRQMLAAAALVGGLLLVSLVSWGIPGPDLGRLNSEPVQPTPTVTRPVPQPTKPSSTNPQSQPPQPIHDNRSDDAFSSTTPSTQTLRGAKPEAGKEKAANAHGNGQGKKGQHSKKRNN